MNCSSALDPESDRLIRSARRQMFLDFCALLEREQIHYAILAGYSGYPERIDSDVDFVVAERDFDRIATLFLRRGCIPGARLIQLLEHETTARYFVFAQKVGSRLAYLHPDAAAGVRKDDRLWLTSRDVLSTRRRSAAGFWIPAAKVEFQYYFVKRVEKGLLEQRHLAALAALQREDPPGCRAALAKLVDPRSIETLTSRIRAEDLAWFRGHGPLLRKQVMASKPLEGPLARWRSRLVGAVRIGRRIVRPTGLVVAVLGPDGSGKTTVLNHLERELAPAFRQVRRFHLRPRFGRNQEGGAVVDPHGQSARGWLLSSLKILMFVVDFAWGWSRIVWPAAMRSTLVLFDRYFHDLLVDPVRYRLPSEFFPARWAASLIPTPHLWLVLTAPAPTLVERKNEITLQAAAALNVRYEALAASLSDAVLINTGQPIDVVLGQAVEAVCQFLAARTASRLSTN